MQPGVDRVERRRGFIGVNMAWLVKTPSFNLLQYYLFLQ